MCLSLVIFFLNPHLPFRPATVARGMAVYGLSGGLLSLLVLAPFTWSRPARAWRLLPWGVTAALGMAAVLAWVLPSYFAFFLPPGINVRLIKAALWLTLSGLVCFYTALLHLVDRRPYGLRSRATFLLLALTSISVLGERRGAFSAPVEAWHRPIAFEAVQRPRLFVVGLEGATFDAILPLAEQGLLPFFAQLIDGGSHGHLVSLEPNRSGALWTTLATGRLPYKHGVVSSRVYPQPALGPGLEIDLVPPLLLFRDWSLLGSEGRLVGADERRVLALWDVLHRFGVDTGLVAWPVTSPVPRHLGFALTDRYFSDPPRPLEAWPPDVEQRARLFQVRPGDPAPTPRAPWDGPVPPGLAKPLAADLWRQGLTSFLLEQQRETSAVFLLLPGLGAVTRRYFGGYSAVQFEGLQRPPYVEAARLLEDYYVFLDGALAELWERQDAPCLMAVVSAYGAEPARGWRRLRAELTARRALEGHFYRSPDGVLLLYGEGVRPRGRLDGAQLVDMAPTLLYGLGFPIARDLDGKVLRGAFEAGFLARHPLTFVPSYEALPARER